MAARRAVVRWAVRLFRREWRQQALILTLLLVAVTTAVLGTSMAYAFAPSRDAEFGTATARVDLVSEDIDLLDSRVDSARLWFGSVEVIDRQDVQIPGTTDSYELRAQDPGGVFGAPMLALRSGRYPTDDDELALTDDMATIFGAEVGDELEIERRTWHVVGMVENPGELSAEFGLVAPGALSQPSTRSLLVDADSDRLRGWPSAGTADVRESFEVRGATEKAAAAVVALGVSAIAMLLVALLAASGFVVVAHRRQRQIGLLAATGATDKLLRLVMVANGAVVGLVSTIAGTAVGLLGWVLLAPRVEQSAGHRLDALDMPWWLVGTAAVLAVASATAASWLPARTVARLPVTAALSGRPPAPRRARRTAIPAFVLLAGGAAAIIWADPNWYLAGEISRPAHDMAVIGGVLAIAIGVLLACPLAVRLLATVAGRLPLAPRLAVRDLSRFRTRSGAALAALSLALGIPVAIVITGSATAKGEDEGSMSDRQMLIRIGDHQEMGAPFGTAAPPEDVAEMRAAVDEFVATSLDGGAAVVQTDVPYDPVIQADLPDAQEVELVVVGRPIEDGYRDLPLSVATPELLAHYDLEPSDVPAGTELVTARSEELAFLGLSQPSDMPTRRAPIAANPLLLEVPNYTMAPHTLITEEALAKYGLETMPSGWLLEASSPLTAEQIAAARQMAIDAGLTIATRPAYGYSSIYTVSVVLGMALALAIVAMTIGLIRSESADDLRTLAATGADRGIRRALTASTAGALGLLGVLCGGLGAYLALTSGYIRTPSVLLERLPVQELLILGLGMPTAAVALGWLLGGHEPPSLVRPRLPLVSITVLLALALAAGACGGDGGDGGRDRGDESTEPEPRTALPLEEFENAILGDDEGRLEQERRVEQRTADCIAALGFEYVPVEPPVGIASGTAADSPWALPADQFAERYGYGLFTIDDPALSDPERGDRAGHVRRRTAGLQRGTAGTQRQCGRSGGRGRIRRGPARARDGVSGPVVAGGVRDVAADVRRVLTRMVHRMRGVDLAALDPAVRRQLQDYEIAVATADFRCRTDYDRVWYEVRREHEEDFVTDHQAELDRFLEAFAAAQSN